jgi:hypothetical protein
MPLLASRVTSRNCYLERTRASYIIRLETRLFVRIRPTHYAWQVRSYALLQALKG